MGTDFMQLLEECIKQLRQGCLTEDRLWELGRAMAENEARRQSLLYLQTATTSVIAQVIGMLMVEDGVVLDGPFDAADWPYKTVLEAIDDGWRVIRFPVQLPAGHTQDTHMNCEFILEKWM